MTAQPEVSLYCVYRAKNAARVRRLCEAIARFGAVPHLWALDRADPRLSRWTRGTGPGRKFELLSKLYEGHRPGEDAWLLLIDDDVEVSRRGWRRLLRTSRAAGFDLSQPAHGRGSHRSHVLTRARFARARMTTFVEIGPVVLVSPRVRNEVVPFPPHDGMGWTLDFAWHDLSKEGYRLGIVDAVRMRHVGAVGQDYDSTEDRRAVRAELDARGLRDVPDMHQTLAVWQWWQAKCPWIGPLPGGRDVGQGATP